VDAGVVVGSGWTNAAGRGGRGRCRRVGVDEYGGSGWTRVLSSARGGRMRRVGVDAGVVVDAVWTNTAGRHGRDPSRSIKLTNCHFFITKR